MEKTTQSAGEHIRQLRESWQRMDERERMEQAKLHAASVMQTETLPAWQSRANASGKAPSRFVMKCFFTEVDKDTGQQKRFTYRGDYVQRDYASRNTRFDSQLAALRCKFLSIAAQCATVIVYDNSLPKPQDELFKMKPGGEIEIDHISFALGRPQFKKP